MPELTTIQKARIDSERPYYEAEAESAIAAGTLTVEKARAEYPDHLAADWQPKTEAAKAAVAKAARIADAVKAATSADAGTSTTTTATTPPSTTAAPVPQAFAAKAAAGSAFAAKATAMLVEHGVMIGIGASTSVDLDGERLTQKAMVKMAHDFCASDKRVFKANHENEVAMKLVENALGTVEVIENGTSRVLKAGEAIPDSAVVSRFDALAASPTHWLIGVKPEGEGAPALLEAAKAGEIAGFSWAGLTNRTTVTA